MHSDTVHGALCQHYPSRRHLFVCHLLHLDFDGISGRRARAAAQVMYAADAQPEDSLYGNADSQ